MSRLSIARALSNAGAAGVVVASFVSLIGIIGIIVNTSTFCPESVGPARCRAASSNAANLAALSLIAGTAAGVVAAVGLAVDPEA